MILEQIVAHKRQEVARQREQVPLAYLEARLDSSPRRPFAARLRQERPGLIAEIKKASPSRGLIRSDFDPAAIARIYTQHGAAAISVLTDEAFFQGKLEYLTLVRGVTPLPLLRKEFIIDPYQIVEAAVAGADAILLIAAILSPAELARYVREAASLGMEALVEVHTEAELEIALASGAQMIGINNRDLRTFTTTLAVTERLAPLVPADRTLVSESGIWERRHVEQLLSLGVHAILVGESLMRAHDIGAKVDELLGRATPSGRSNGDLDQGVRDHSA